LGSNWLLEGVDGGSVLGTSLVLGKPERCRAANVAGSLGLVSLVSGQIEAAQTNLPPLPTTGELSHHCFCVGGAKHPIF
jgi:hypothetical protein